MDTWPLDRGVEEADPEVPIPKYQRDIDCHKLIGCGMRLVSQDLMSL